MKLECQLQCPGRRVVVWVNDISSLHGLMEQFHEVHIFPDAIFSDMPIEGLSVRKKETVAEESASEMVIVPTGNYWDAYDEIAQYKADMTKNIVRSNMFFADILKTATVQDLVCEGDLRWQVWFGMNIDFVLGGVETWIVNEALALMRAGVDMKILEVRQKSHFDYVGPSFYGLDNKYVISVDEHENFVKNVMMCLEYIVRQRPSHYVDNGNYASMTAIAIAKRSCGMPIRVVSVVHGDAEIFYQRVQMFENVIDSVIAVNTEICEKLKRRSALPVNIYLQLPEPDEQMSMPPNTHDPIRIAYAGRLEDENKRCLWLRDVAEELERIGIPYEMHVAGDGSAYGALEAFAKQSCRKSAIKLYKMIPKEQMPEFYANKDVFVNFSISEGGPLTLYEAMAHGLVSIVTNTGAAPLLIQEHVNGFMIQSPNDAAGYIAALSENRKQLFEMRSAAIRMLRQRREYYAQNFRRILIGR